MQMKKTGRYALSFLDSMACCFQRSKVSRLLKRFPAFFCNGRSPLAWGAIGCTWLGHFLIKRKPLPVHLTAAMILIGFIICFAGTWPLLYPYRKVVRSC